MNFTNASPGSLAAFSVIVVFVIGAVMLGVWRSSIPEARVRTSALAGGGIVAWLGLISVAVGSGFIEAVPMPRAIIFLGLSNLMGVVLALSPLGGRLATAIPITFLVGFQAFRLPLELVLHSWGVQGTIPMTMTWEGSNFDVISGALALCCAPLAGKYRAAAWIANGVGFVLLLNVGRVAILSSPFPFAWGVEPPLQLPFHLPYAWIVPVCVAGALAGHIVLTRALLSPKSL